MCCFSVAVVAVVAVVVAVVVVVVVVVVVHCQEGHTLSPKSYVNACATADADVL